MAIIQSLGFMAAQSQHLDAWEKFGAQGLGMQVERHPRNGLLFRLDDRAQRFWIQEGPSEDVEFLAWEASDLPSLEQLFNRLKSGNVEVVWGRDDEIEDRSVERFFKFRDPSGSPHEVFCGLKNAATPFHSSVIRGHFVTKDQGMGHAVILQRDLEEAVNFYQTMLGFGVSDYITEQVDEKFAVTVAFMHVNPRHHSLALAPAPKIHKRLDHVMIQVDNMDDVGLAFDRVLENGMIIHETLGRHPNDRMFSFYATTPSGWRIEMGWGAITVTPEKWESTIYPELSEWGHRKPDGRKRLEKEQVV